METFDDLKLERYINKALLEKSFGRTELYDTLFGDCKGATRRICEQRSKPKTWYCGITLQEEKGYRGRESRLNQDNRRPL